jgi:polyisoprenyl-phosphate glycosyltransferase
MSNKLLRNEPPMLCVVSPCFNEAAGIAIFHGELKAALNSLRDTRHRIVFVDDGSTDGTLAELNRIAAADPTVRVYSLSRNFGHQVALSAGLEVARGDAVLMMDSDCQHPPALIPQMVEQWRGGMDVVSAVRECRADQNWIQRYRSDAFYSLINWLSDTPIVARVADFCLLSRRAHRALRSLPERHRFVRGLVSWIGFPRSFLTYEAPPRAAGTSKYTLRRLIALALDAVFSFSARPIKTAGRLGLVIVLAGMAYLLYILADFFVGSAHVPGWASLISVLLILNGLQLIFIGLSGQYQARIFEEVKGRPLYFFKQVPPRRAVSARAQARARAA